MLTAVPLGWLPAGPSWLDAGPQWRGLGVAWGGKAGGSSEQVAV